MDLDQVLNDFEYSELTTEQAPPPPVPRVPQKNYSSTKHSINNVFSSLNDYLATEINENIVQYNNVDNKYESRTDAHASESTAAGNIVEYPSISNLYAAASPVYPQDVKDITLDTPAVVQMTPVKEKPLESLIAQPILLKIEDSQVVDDTWQEKLEEIVTASENNQLLDLDNYINAEEGDNHEEYSAEVKLEEVNGCNQPDEAENTSEIPEDDKLTQEEEVEVEEVFASPSIEEKPAFVEPPAEVVEENVEIIEIDINSNSNLDSMTETYCDKIGFHIEVADEEAAKYLADLEDGEDEEEEESFHDATVTVSPVDVVVVTPVDIKENVEEDKNEVVCEVGMETQRPNSLNIKEDAVNLIGNPGSTPYNNVYVSKEMPQSAVEAQYESGSSVSVSPTFSEASTDSVHSVEQTTLPQETVTQDNAVVAEENPASVHLNEENVDDQEQNETSAHQLMSEEDCINHDAGPEVAPAEANANSNSILEPVEDLHAHAHEHEDAAWLGKRAPIWTPDADALNCQHCEFKFTVIKRRHHCRACGLVLCSKCCGMKHKLEYLGAEARVCTRCHEALARETDSGSGDSQHSTPRRDNDITGDAAAAAGQPNPNNPMEYCSVVPPHEQVRAGGSTPSVMVPVGVLKRKGSNKKHNKSVMFCDGIRPGSDLTNLDQDFNYNDSRKSTSGVAVKKASSQPAQQIKLNKNLPMVDPVTQSFIPENENCLPPTVTTYKSDITYTECGNNANVVEMLKNETLTFAVQRNLHIHVRLILMDCCVNKQAWCFSTEGLIAVGQDEIVILLEYAEGEAQVPKDVFHHLNNIYNSAVKGTTVTELGLSIHPTTNFLDSRNHAGFIFVRPTFQCLQNVIVPKEPYLVGVLVHRWETPWARIFPLRLVLRLGAEYRYYPAPLISTRHRDSVFVEIGHTIINLLADFRNFSYTLPNIRGLTIHMEEKSTTVSIPVNRYDQVMKSMSNSSEHILAFGGNFSSEADSHLVCIQDTQGSDENNYKTHAINIQNKPRKVTGASFIVFNGALKSSSGLTAKSSIVEDGLMIQIPPEHMVKVRESLRNMKNHSIQCGCVNVASDETVNIVWSEADVNFNLGVKSSVDGQSLSGVPSIRVHNGKDYTCNSGARLVRWTEVFLLQSGEENARTQDPVDISKVAESISKATCQALVKYLDLLATNSFMKIGIRTTLHVDDVSYAAGSNGQKLPPIYMKSLDNELVPVLHRITSSGNVGDGTIVLELIFRILNV